MERRERGDMIFGQIKADAARLAEYGQVEAAQAVTRAAEKAEATFQDFWNQPLSVNEAAEWGGYSESRLRDLLKGKEIPTAPDGGIRRRHVPIRPGHALPLDLEPQADGSMDQIRQLVNRRAS